LVINSESCVLGQTEVSSLGKVTLSADNATVISSSQVDDVVVEGSEGTRVSGNDSVSIDEVSSAIDNSATNWETGGSITDNTSDSRTERGNEQLNSRGSSEDNVEADGWGLGITRSGGIARCTTETSQWTESQETEVISQVGAETSERKTASNVGGDQESQRCIINFNLNAGGERVQDDIEGNGRVEHDGGQVGAGVELRMSHSASLKANSNRSQEITSSAIGGSAVASSWQAASDGSIEDCISEIRISDDTCQVTSSGSQQNVVDVGSSSNDSVTNSLREIFELVEGTLVDTSSDQWVDGESSVES
jgi:hypothetical protein